MTPEKSSATDRAPSVAYQIGDDETILEAVLAAVESVTGTPPDDAVAADGGTEPTPLYEVIDPDALASLSSPANPDQSDWRVSFPYCRCSVAVTSDDAVEVERRSPNPNEIDD